MKREIRYTDIFVLSVVLVSHLESVTIIKKFMWLKFNFNAANGARSEEDFWSKKKKIFTWSWTCQLWFPRRSGTWWEIIHHYGTWSLWKSFYLLASLHHRFCSDLDLVGLWQINEEFDLVFKLDQVLSRQKMLFF